MDAETCFLMKTVHMTKPKINRLLRTEPFAKAQLYADSPKTGKNSAKTAHFPRWLPRKTAETVE